MCNNLLHPAEGVYCWLECTGSSRSYNHRNAKRLLQSLPSTSCPGAASAWRTRLNPLLALLAWLRPQVPPPPKGASPPEDRGVFPATIDLGRGMARLLLKAHRTATNLDCQTLLPCDLATRTHPRSHESCVNRSRLGSSISRGQSRRQQIARSPKATGKWCHQWPWLEPRICEFGAVGPFSLTRLLADLHRCTDGPFAVNFR